MSAPGRSSDRLYRLSRFLVRLWLKLYLRFESHGSENIPATGGCIIASNHVSYLDPPVIACGVTHRLIHFMARDTLLRTRIGGWFFEGVQCISIDRNRGDVAALRKAIHVLKSGEALAVFPEGTRSLDGALKAAKGGIGFLIAKAAVPVVPAYVDGSYDAFPKGAKWIKPGRVRVFYGPAVQPAEFAALGDDRVSYERLGALVMSRISGLKPA